MNNLPGDYTFYREVKEFGEMKQMYFSNCIVTKCAIIAFFKVQGFNLSFRDIGNFDSLIAPSDMIDDLNGLMEGCSFMTSITDISSSQRNDSEPDNKETFSPPLGISYDDEAETSKDGSTDFIKETKEAENSFYDKNGMELLENKTFNCDECSRSFVTRGSLKAHFYRTHYERKVNFQCSTCPKVFIHKSDLVKHSETHSTATNFKCSSGDCKKEFKYEKNLKAHIKKHNNPETFLCSQCGKSLSSQFTLDDHIFRVHGSIKAVFKCKLCLKCFNVKSNLSRHVRTCRSSL